MLFKMFRELILLCMVQSRASELCSLWYGYLPAESSLVCFKGPHEGVKMKDWAFASIIGASRRGWWRTRPWLAC